MGWSLYDDEEIKEVQMKKNAYYWSLLVGSLLVAPGMAQAADLFVQSVRAPILSAPSLGSPKVAEAVKGESLKELEIKGFWYRVGYKKTSGWVSRLLVGPKPPAVKVSILEETSERLETGARKRASAFTTAAAARGLAEERARISDKFKVDYYSLETVEAIKVSDEEAVKFVQAGVGR